MSPRFWVGATAVLVVFVAAGTCPCEDKKAKPAVVISISTDKKRYDADGTMLIAVDIGANIRDIQIQISPHGNGSIYFYLILESLDQKERAAKDFAECVPAWETQFVEKPFIRQSPKSQLIEVDTGFTQQLAIYLPRLRGLPEGKYALRVGYAIHGESLGPVIEKATGQKLKVDSIDTPRLDGAYSEPILSDAVTITSARTRTRKSNARTASIRPVRQAEVKKAKESK